MSEDAPAVRGGCGGADFTAHNKRLSEMAVGVETGSLLHPSTSVVAQVMARPIRHFAKPLGVMCDYPLVLCGVFARLVDEIGR